MTEATGTRRSFLRVLCLISGALISLRQSSMLVARDDSPSFDPLSLKLVDFFSEKGSARRIGLEYIRLAPAEADSRTLTKLICSGWNDDQIASANKEKVSVLLRNQQRGDFERGRILKLDGWVLSETEARLCALVAIV